MMSASSPLTTPPIAQTPEVAALLAQGAAVAIGVSGGKDSQACAALVIDHLNRIGHTGPRILVHCDLGMVEWAESLPACQDLARHLQTELAILTRPAGGLMERWEARWRSSQARYKAMDTMTLVLPWSTPSMRFCTSELKTHLITAALRRRFKDIPIVNVTGVRRAESAGRARATIASPNRGASRAESPYWDWRPLVDYSTEDVFTAIDQAGLTPHRAYTEFGMSRVSCAFCIMSNTADMQASARNPEHIPLYRRMVALEAASSFGFQGGRWLADVRPEVLTPDLQAAVAEGKRRAGIRTQIESQLPRTARYTATGWPQAPITREVAQQIATVRTTVLTLFGWDSPCRTPDEVFHNYNARYEARIAKDQSRQFLLFEHEATGPDKGAIAIETTEEDEDAPRV
ncbi:MAG: phosphoadenosine phosphosulfate reductase family protein [Gammaproteobacteria bacterium]|nr:phosphoadenosine phosphosulfate reductase family protein [Gammaproteobacteria bacterium]